MNLFKFAFLGLALTLGFASCDKEATADLDTQDLNYLLDLEADALVDELAIAAETEGEAARAVFATGEDAAEGHVFSGDCFALVYPVGIDYPDGTSTTAADPDELKAQIRAYVSTNPRPRRRGTRPQLSFPLTIQLADGSLETLDNRRELFAQLRECRPEVDPCYTLVFPVSVTLGDRTLSADDAEALRLAIRTSRQANPDAGAPRLVFPVEVESATGEVIEVASREEFYRLRRTCRTERRECFTFVYPVTIQHRSAGQKIVEDAAQLRRAFSHANGRGRWMIVYPVSVTIDGNTVAVESAEGLRRVRQRCR